MSLSDHSRPGHASPAEKDRLAVCHFNVRSIYPMVLQQEHLDSLAGKYRDPLLHSCFGLAMAGPGLTSKDDNNLQSGLATDLRLDLYALTQNVDAPEQWSAAWIRSSRRSEQLPWRRRARASAWWTEFWNRSWLHVEGASDAAKVSQGYAMQRYFDACAGRGAQPIKYNGSILRSGTMSMAIKWTAANAMPTSVPGAVAFGIKIIG